ncbi:2-succinyl-5-enolpyruvyl-6-hydroxy-3-cyclohexene-1-carboxylic-acid synthase [Glutamicibacter ardleyensis]|uniref:2-succinyl-5-enolpyruvyl-6-hydroxy-3- cyclohexene-1-carboxylic-acid synthase n=1 Tax=Glutamicibacter ardleyensis TaxID=225894 RepID=UPI001E4E8100|nr:2-succinyl-5-enolpyruvyl-6-hydroxy-3-cyclohexene-1-carboxylic-acid synthase [Glutamicibacter ardleyensis]
MSARHEDGQPAIDTARQVLAGLIVAGVREIVLSPGSRSAPLAYAAAEAEATGVLRIHVRIDERSAGFLALGLSQGSQTPVALIATSGTAIGELLPAIMEANHTATPLLVLSADRPDELLGTGASQSTDQKQLFGTHVRTVLNVPAGADPSQALTEALSALAGSATRPGGPVQLNLQFRDPLTPGPTDTVANQRWTELDAALWQQSAQPVNWSVPEGLEERRTVVVAGHDTGGEAQAFARQLGLPLFAEPSSNARFSAHAIGHYRPLLAVGAAQIERVVLFGRPTLSRPVGRLLADPAVTTAIWQPTPVSWYEPGRRRERIISTPTELLSFAGKAPEHWLRSWQELDAQALAVCEELYGSEQLTGPSVAQTVWSTVNGPLLLGSSNIIRDFDLCAAPAAAASGQVFANRGLAGIDGTISTGLGLALATGKPTVSIMGDITFLHDASAMLWTPGEPAPDLDVVVYNDGGGAIFSTLEHGQVAESGRYGQAVERLFATPQNVQLQPLAIAYGWDYQQASTQAELRQVLRAPKPGKLRLIEITADRSTLRKMNLELISRIAELRWPAGA